MALSGRDQVRVEAFKVSARALLEGGFSANQILQSARTLGFGIRRSEGLNIIRDLREQQFTATAASETATEITAELPAREYKWGILTQETDQYLRFDGPHALLFQVGSEAGPDWSDYVILPEDQEVSGFRFVVEEDEPSDPNDQRNGPFYRTTGSVPPDEHPSRAMARMGIDPGRVVRVIYDLP